jgi:hypothetical protein
MGLAATILLLSAQSPVRASTVLNDLVEWNLELSENHDRFVRSRVYAQLSAAMKRKYTQVS